MRIASILSKICPGLTAERAQAAASLAVLLAVPLLALVALGAETFSFAAFKDDSTGSLNPVVFAAPATDLAKIGLMRQVIRPAATRQPGANDEVVLEDWRYTAIPVSGN